MLSAHAILIISERFARNRQRSGGETMVRNIHSDLLMGLTQRFYLVYAQIRPLFFQAARREGDEAAPRMLLAGVEVKHPLQFDEQDHAASMAVRIAAAQEKLGLPRCRRSGGR